MLFFDFWWPDDSKGSTRDADNYVKMIKDALEDVIYLSDNSVKYHDAFVHGVSGEGRIEVNAARVTQPLRDGFENSDLIWNGRFKNETK
tara:strand:- start:2925 stop:3191 length:267 start_codon:yes stop_codon:yes gene_type:complete